MVEVPLLFESELHDRFDATIAIVAEESIRQERAGARDQAGLEGREARQLSQAEKAAKADHVVVNDGTVEDLEMALLEVLDRLGVEVPPPPG